MAKGSKDKGGVKGHSFKRANVKPSDVKGRKKGMTESMKKQKGSYKACVDAYGGSKATMEIKTKCAKKFGGGRK